MTTKTAFASVLLALLAGAASAQQAPNNNVQVQDKTQPTPRLNPATDRAEHEDPENLFHYRPLAP